MFFAGQRCGCKTRPLHVSIPEVNANPICAIVQCLPSLGLRVRAVLTARGHSGQFTEVITPELLQGIRVREAPASTVSKSLRTIASGYQLDTNKVLARFDCVPHALGENEKTTASEPRLDPPQTLDPVCIPSSDSQPGVCGWQFQRLEHQGRPDTKRPVYHGVLPAFFDVRSSCLVAPAAGNISVSSVFRVEFGVCVSAARPAFPTSPSRLSSESLPALRMGHHRSHL